MVSGGAASIDFYGGSFTLAATALCCYEYALTLDEEVRCIWRRGVSAASALFVLNRYAMLAASLASLIQVLPWGQESQPRHRSEHVCATVVRFVDVCLILINIAYAVFAALRMLAIYTMSKSIFALVLIVGLCNPCAQIYLMSVEASGNSGGISPNGSLTPTTTGRIDCYHSVATALLPADPARASVADLVYRLPLLRLHALAFEGLLIGLTWKKMAARWTPRGRLVRTPFTTALMRNGTLYFATIATASVVNLVGVLVLVLYPTVKLSDSTYLAMVALASAVPIVDTITSICMSRFILGLLAISLDDRRVRSSQWDTLRFASTAAAVVSIASTFGADLHSGDMDGVEAEAEVEELPEEIN